MSSKKTSFRPEAFEHFNFWLRTDRRILIRIMDLLSEILRSPFEGKGKPEPLKHQLKGLWSRRITDEHRLVYSVSQDEVTVFSCRFHYKR